MVTLSRWNPFSDLDALRHEVERAFESFGFETPFRTPFRAAFLPGNAARNYPLLNIAEDKDTVYVEALAPGLDPEKVEISVTGNRLQIAGEKQALSQDIKPEAFHRKERGSGRFVRTIDLSTEVNTAAIAADYKDGLLTIRLPKSEAAKPKQITVNVK